MPASLELDELQLIVFEVKLTYRMFDFSRISIQSLMLCKIFLGFQLCSSSFLLYCGI
jgi:hypothetical protein